MDCGKNFRIFIFLTVINLKKSCEFCTLTQ